MIDEGSAVGGTKDGIAHAGQAIATHIALTYRLKFDRIPCIEKIRLQWFAFR